MIREQERKKSFDSTFIQLARSVYKKNDQRSALKKEINIAYGSNYIEENHTVHIDPLATLTVHNTDYAINISARLKKLIPFICCKIMQYAYNLQNHTVSSNETQNN